MFNIKRVKGMKFSEYKTKIKELIVTVSGGGKIDSEVAMRVIKFLGLRMCDVDNNPDYFSECFDNEYTPIKAIESLRYNEDELLRDIESFSDDLLMEEVKNRRLHLDIIRDADTDDLEYEIENRWDKSLCRVNQMDRDELLDALGLTEDNIYTTNDPREAICKALGLSNSFAYTNDELIEIIKEKINYI